MTRSPLFYPLHRGDSDAGGAADLQTDIMRFMAILALCLVAIFALVQSIPLIPEAPAQPSAAAAPPPLPVEADRSARPEASDRATAEPVTTAAKPDVVLTRPRWASTFVPGERSTQAQPSPVVSQLQPETGPPSAEPAATDQGFTLRFESDIALTRLVAAGQIGLYAIVPGRAQRMAVQDSSISFWDASAPGAFHEMETMTVPRPVIDALARTGIDTAAVNWGVTLPGPMRQQLDVLMRDNAGGELVIGADGRLRLDVS